MPDNNNDVKVEYVEMTDPMTDEKIQVPKNLEVFIGHVRSANRNQAKKQKQEEIDSLNTQVEDYETQLTELKKTLESKPGDLEKFDAFKNEYETRLKEKNELVTKAMNEGTVWKDKFVSVKKRNDLQDALSGFDVHNHAHTVNTLMQEGKAELIERIDLGTGQPTGDYETKLSLTITDSEGQSQLKVLSAREAVKAFFAMPENAFHLKNKMSAGSGSQESTNQPVSSLDKLSSQYDEAIKNKEPAKAMMLKEQYQRTKAAQT